MLLLGLANTSANMKIQLIPVNIMSTTIPLLYGAVLALVLNAAHAVEAPPSLAATMAAPKVKAIRFEENPIIRQDMPDLVESNINGPSLIRVPSWVPNPLGKYYLYFASHHGTGISLAYADNLAGPWTIFRGDVLKLDETSCYSHIASPNVHVDNQNKEFRMYFHGDLEGHEYQFTFLAHSVDGLKFTAGTQPLGPSYFSVFQHGGWFYTVTKIKGEGRLWRSRDGVTMFEEGPALIPRMRHSGVKVDGESLYLFYTRIGDAPERIFVTRIDMRSDWMQWRDRMSLPALVLQPEKTYEGADLPAGPSRKGAARRRVNELRDPAIFEEGNKTYILYSVAGESGLAIAELILNSPN